MQQQQLVLNVITHFTLSFILSLLYLFFHCHQQTPPQIIQKRGSLCSKRLAKKKKIYIVTIAKNFPPFLHVSYVCVCVLQVINVPYALDHENIQSCINNFLLCSIMRQRLQYRIEWRGTGSITKQHQYIDGQTIIEDIGTQRSLFVCMLVRACVCVCTCESVRVFYSVYKRENNNLFAQVSGMLVVFNEPHSPAGCHNSSVYEHHRNLGSILKALCIS